MIHPPVRRRAAIAQKPRRGSEAATGAAVEGAAVARPPVLEWADVAEADSAPAPLPTVSAGPIGLEVLPLRAYPGFARLFEPTSEQ